MLQFELNHTYDAYRYINIYIYTPTHTYMSNVNVCYKTK